MLDRSKKEVKDFEIASGLLVGYIVAGFINMYAFDKNWEEAFSEQKLLVGFAGIAISIFIIIKAKRKGDKNREL